MFEIGGILAGGVDANQEVSIRVLLVQQFQSFVQALIASSILRYGEGLGGRSAIGPKERDAMAVASGVDSDADAIETRCIGHRRVSTMT